MIKRREDNWRAQINSNLNEFGLLRPVCSRPTLDVRLRDRQTDRQTDSRQTDIRFASSFNAPYARNYFGCNAPTRQTDADGETDRQTGRQ